ncbi:hypothetical protein PCC7424_5214 [Gloeothece citriformis PCC 7424]|uniref:Uncharacterized protein n=1 Tax=Gloeothece citriformis (strain PCC 7424) TaxID=65393 RepID=B7KI75_GLOC7|nr:hypothetical protein PCC7424_5214 [Gloeothece citriformis PCC 7424]
MNKIFMRLNLNHKHFWKNFGLKRLNDGDWLFFIITITLGLVFTLLTFAISIHLKTISSLKNYDPLIKHDYYSDSD